MKIFYMRWYEWLWEKYPKNAIVSIPHEHFGCTIIKLLIKFL